MEHGIYASWDSGKNWEKINIDLPNVSVRDLRIQKRDRDLVVGTHGRGAYILDDIRPLEELDGIMDKSIHLFPIREGVLWNMYWRLENLGDKKYTAKNPEYGTYINYYLNHKPKSSIEVKIFDKQNNLITTLEDENPEKGINRLTWDLGYDSVNPLNVNEQGKLEIKKTKPGKTYEGLSEEIRPKVAPGIYKAEIKYNNTTEVSEFVVSGDYRIEMPVENYKLKSEALVSLRDLQNHTHKLIENILFIEEQIEALAVKLKVASSKDLPKLERLLNKIKTFKDDHLMRPPPSMGYRQKPRLKEEIKTLMRAIDNTTNPPTIPQQERIKSLKQELDVHLRKMEDFKVSINQISSSHSSLPQIIMND